MIFRCRIHVIWKLTTILLAIWNQMVVNNHSPKISYAKVCLETKIQSFVNYHLSKCPFVISLHYFYDKGLNKRLPVSVIYKFKRKSFCVSLLFWHHSFRRLQAVLLWYCFWQPNIWIFQTRWATQWRGFDRWIRLDLRLVYMKVCFLVERTLLCWYDCVLSF